MKYFTYITDKSEDEFKKALAENSLGTPGELRKEGIYSETKDNDIQITYYPGIKIRWVKGTELSWMFFSGSIEYSPMGTVIHGRYKMHSGAIWLLGTIAVFLIPYLWINAVFFDSYFFFPAILVTVVLTLMVYSTISSTRDYVYDIADFMKHKLNMRPYFKDSE